MWVWMVVCPYIWPCDGLVNSAGCTSPSPVDIAGICSSARDWEDISDNGCIWWMDSKLWFFFACFFRLFQTMQFEGKLKAYQLLALMKTAHGKAVLRSMRWEDFRPPLNLSMTKVDKLDWADSRLCFPQMSHEGHCEFMIIPCPSCKECIRFNEQERHNERECPERTLNCKYCKEPFHFKNIKVRNDLFRLQIPVRS